MSEPTDAPAGGGFSALLADLEQMASTPMAKALKADDDDDDDKRDEDGDGDGAGGEGEGEAFGKSFKVTLPDGSEREAYDGTAMMKALHGEVTALKGALSANTDSFTKALTAATTIIKDQGAMLKSMAERLDKISAAPAGRRATVTVHDKGGSSAAPAAPAQPDGQMLKSLALEALGAGNITIQDSIRIGMKVDSGQALSPVELHAIGAKNAA